LCTLPRSSSGARRSIAANSAAFVTGDTKNGTAIGMATSGEGSSDRGARELIHEQRVGERAECRAEVREHLADPEEPEVPVVPECDLRSSR
jgi:hypothetical protein